MRTWGRVPAEGFSSVDVSNPTTYVWVEVSTDTNGYNDQVWVTTLSQVLQLGLNESPIFANYGIPAQQSVVTETPPDYYVSLTQQQFAQYFISLILFTNSSSPPTYSINAVPNAAAILMSPVPV